MKLAEPSFRNKIATYILPNADNVIDLQYIIRKQEVKIMQDFLSTLYR